MKCLQFGAACGMMFPSEQVLGTHSIANYTDGFFMPSNCIPVRRKVRRSSIMLCGTSVLANWVPSLDERRTLRAQEQPHMAQYAKTCVVCGKQFTSNWHSKVACSAKCQELHRQSKARRINSVNKKKKKLIKERGNRCELCGATGTLHAHHVKAMARGGSDDAGNLLLVCPACHKKFHSRGR